MKVEYITVEKIFAYFDGKQTLMNEYTTVCVSYGYWNEIKIWL